MCITSCFFYVAERLLEQLPDAPPPEPRQLSKSEKDRLYEQEETTLRELRLFLRDVLNKLCRDRKFTMFTKPVDEEDVGCILHHLSV